MTVSRSALNNASFENYPDLICHLYYSSRDTTLPCPQCPVPSLSLPLQGKATTMYNVHSKSMSGVQVRKIQSHHVRTIHRMEWWISSNASSSWFRGCGSCQYTGIGEKVSLEVGRVCSLRLRGATNGDGWQAESIKRFIEGQVFLRSDNLAPSPSSPLPRH